MTKLSIDRVEEHIAKAVQKVTAAEGKVLFAQAEANKATASLRDILEEYLKERPDLVCEIPFAVHWMIQFGMHQNEELNKRVFSK